MNISEKSIEVINLYKFYESPIASKLPGPYQLPSAVVKYFFEKKRKKYIAALSDINFTVDKHDYVLVLGPNGSGKTTLLKILAGLMFPSKGTVKILGKKLEENLSFVRSKVTLISSLTTGCALFDPFISVEQNLSLISELLRIDYNNVLKFIELLKVDKYLNYKFGALSTGTAARVILALNLAKPAEIYLFDEPAEALSPEGRELFKRILLKLKQDQKTVIYATHHPQELAEVFNRVLLLINGRIVFNGTIQDFLNKVFKGKDAYIEIEFYKEIKRDILENIDLPEKEYMGKSLIIYTNILKAHLYLNRLFSHIKVDYIKSVRIIPRSLEEAYLTYVKRR